MEKKLVIFAYGDGRLHISVSNSVERSTSGKSLTEVITAMHPEDSKILAAFADAVRQEIKPQLGS